MSWLPVSLEKILLSQVSNATLVFRIGSSNIKIMNFVSRMSLLRDQFQVKLTFRFGVLSG